MCGTPPLPKNVVPVSSKVEEGQNLKTGERERERRRERARGEKKKKNEETPHCNERGPQDSWQPGRLTTKTWGQRGRDSADIDHQHCSGLLKKSLVQPFLLYSNTAQTPAAGIECRYVHSDCPTGTLSPRPSPRRRRTGKNCPHATGCAAQGSLSFLDVPELRLFLAAT